jgi:predicted helicase
VKRKAKVHYHAVPGDWRREEKEQFLDGVESIAGVKWGKPLKPDPKYRWLTGGSDDQFEEFLPVGSKEAKAVGGASGQATFRNYSRGISTGRDSSIFAFEDEPLREKAQQLVETYNLEVLRYSTSRRARSVEEFIASGSAGLKWTDRLKEALGEKRQLTYDEGLIRNALYRPFTRKIVYFDELLTHRRYQQHNFFPTPKTEAVNRQICLTDIGGRSPFSVLMADRIAELHLCATVDTFQCFPLYTFSEDGKERRDNIPRSTLDRFIAQYDDDTITREQIFHYVYAVLHHPDYRARYAENLKRQLPRIPLTGTAQDFHAFATAGRQLADLHVGYESVKPFKLKRLENNAVPPNWRVEAMKLTKEGDAVIYNEWLTLHGVPPEAHEYRLGNRSALAWVIDQYRVDRDAAGDLSSDPNDPADEEAIVRLVGQVITVSVETMKLIHALPELKLP